MQLHHFAVHLLSCYIAIASASTESQQVMIDPHDSISPQTTSKPTLADLLTIETSTSIFYSYAREVELSTIFSDVNGRTTVLVPTNKAVMALARKPHQGPEQFHEGIEISEEDFDKASKQNVEQWISAHVIPQSPISILPGARYTTLLRHKSVSFSAAPDADPKSPEWAQVLLNNGARIIGMKEALNGVMYIIDGTVTVD